MPSLDDRVAALEIALVELAKFLGRDQQIGVTQLAAAIETQAKASRASAPAQAAALELARKLR